MGRERGAHPRNVSVDANGGARRASKKVRTACRGRAKGVFAMRGRIGTGALTLAAALLIALVLAGCDSGGGQVVATVEDDGGSVTLDPGQELAVKLESNPSTGYSWEAIEIPGVLDGSAAPEHEADPEDGNVVGAAGTDVFTFTAAQTSGESGTLVLVYRRPWETDVEPEDEFVLEVSVR